MDMGKYFVTTNHLGTASKGMCIQWFGAVTDERIQELLETGKIAPAPADHPAVPYDQSLVVNDPVSEAYAEQKKAEQAARVDTHPSQEPLRRAAQAKEAGSSVGAKRTRDAKERAATRNLTRRPAPKAPPRAPAAVQAEADHLRQVEDAEV